MLIVTMLAVPQEQIIGQFVADSKEQLDQRLKELNFNPGEEGGWRFNSPDGKPLLYIIESEVDHISTLKYEELLRLR